MATLSAYHGTVIDRLRWCHRQFLEAADEHPGVHYAIAHDHVYKNHFLGREPDDELFPINGFSSRLNLIQSCASASHVWSGPETTNDFDLTYLGCDMNLIGILWIEERQTELESLNRDLNKVIYRIEPTLPLYPSGIPLTSVSWPLHVFEYVSSINFEAYPTDVDEPWEFDSISVQHLGVEYPIACAMAIEGIIRKMEDGPSEGPTSTSREFSAITSSAPIAPPSPSRINALQVKIIDAATANPGMTGPALARAISESMTFDTIRKDASELTRHGLMISGNGYHVTPWGSYCRQASKNTGSENGVH